MMNYARTFLTVLIGTAVLCPLALQAAVVVRSPADLAADKRVQAQLGNFQLVSSSSVFYDQCAAVYNLTPEQIDFQKTLFESVAAQYIQTFHDIYVERVAYPPNQAMIDSYMQFIRSQHEAAANDATRLLQAKAGCAGRKVQSAIYYIEKLRHAELVAKANQPPARRTHAPAVAAVPDAAPVTPSATTQGSL